MSLLKKVVILGLIGSILGVFLIPREMIANLIWSYAEQYASRQGLSVSCSTPKIGLRELNTGPCSVRFKAFGVPLDFLSIRLSGVFPPRITAITQAFGELCDAELDTSQIVVKRCGVAINNVPQLMGLGFNSGKLLVQDLIISNAADVLSGLSGDLQLVDVNHPTMTVTKLGFAKNAPILMIPAFEGGNAQAKFRASKSEKELLISGLTSSILKAPLSRVLMRHTDSTSTLPPVLEGHSEFELIGDGIRQYRPLLEGLARGGQLGATNADLDAPSSSGEAQNRYTLVIAGSLTKPSFRVLKSSETR